MDGGGADASFVSHPDLDDKSDSKNEISDAKMNGPGGGSSLAGNVAPMIVDSKPKQNLNKEEVKVNSVGELVNPDNIQMSEIKAQ